MPHDDDIAPPRRPWLPKPSDRFSTDSQELSAAEIMKARSTTRAPAVKVAASQAVYFSPLALANRPPGIRPTRPTSRPPFLSIMQNTGTGTGTGLPSGITITPNRMKPLPNAPTPNRFSQNRPRRGATVASQPQAQAQAQTTGRPLSRQVSSPSSGGTSITLRGQQAQSASTPVPTVPTTGVTRAASKGKGKGKDEDKDEDKDKDEDEDEDKGPDTPPPALPALPAPVGIARILAEMTDEVENGERVQEKKVDTRKLRTPPFPTKRSGPATRSPRF